MEGLLGDVFRAVLELGESEDLRTLERGTSESWDSLAHVLLVSGVESEFAVTIDLDAALELNTFEDFLRFLDGETAEAESG